MMTMLINGKYDAKALAFRVTYQNEAIRESEAYEDELDRVYEATMSCNRREAIMWTKKFMEDAVSYGVNTKDRSWKEKFLAAYDVCNAL